MSSPLTHWLPTKLLTPTSPGAPYIYCSSQSPQSHASLAVLLIRCFIQFPPPPRPPPCGTSLRDDSVLDHVYVLFHAAVSSAAIYLTVCVLVSDTFSSVWFILYYDDVMYYDVMFHVRLCSWGFDGINAVPTALI